MKKIACALCFFLALILVGCSQNTNHEVNINRIFAEEYSIEELELEVELKEPRGLTMIGDDLIIVDSGNNRLLRINKSGKLVQTIGETGHGNGEFLNPVAVAVDEQFIYVADSGNSRVQKLTMDGSFIEDWKIEGLQNFTITNRMLDIEVDANQNIYLSVLSLNNKLSKVHILNSGGKVSTIGKDSIGYLGIENNQLFFVSILERIDRDTLEGRNNQVFEIIDGKMVNKKSLPTSYSPADLTFYNEQMYMFSRGYQAIDRFNLDGDYIDSIWRREITDGNADTNFSAGMYGMHADEKGDIYMSNYLENKIYKFSNKE
ncbi:NHL repeat-containing protein [Bacillus horti]|uniref:DNA-binding beta-propeller fold protein YncE n=1 Tax=Caldalkalibacillus horti TaxID=77523 RepID=A0ABT9VUV3_9BACI|nr:NHL repeat-containing protein [Bacillus horti]MDQ0164776.1 DNA-binding beta-propeller fold protein YncE [Bacillus horti]